MISINRFCHLCLIVCAFLITAGCANTPPRHVENICHIFDEKKGWYKAARKAEKRWDSKIPIMMAIMHQESRFQPKARPPRSKILWFIPGPRKSSAYGFSQAKDETWNEYRRSSGNRWGKRNHFEDAVDFVGWYNKQSQRRSKIALHDTYNLYLAYHEGHGGFNRRTFRNKKWLTDVARKVSERSALYSRQLAGCEKRLQSSWWWPF